jgi:hypothetical protein
MNKLNNNQTCIHQAVAPTTLEECIHFEKEEHICPVCAYEIGFLEGSSQRWSCYEDYISSKKDISNCSIGTQYSKADFEIISENQNFSAINICIYCSFKTGFEAAYISSFDEFKLEIVAKPKNLLLEIFNKK